MSQFHLPLGSMLGRYRIEREIGRGGFGVVYLAHDTSLDVQIALKLLAPQFAHDSEAVQRFKRELVLARAVTHPGICRVFDLQDEGDRRFITMEYIDGESLEALLEEHGRLPVARAVHILRQACSALAAAHAAGIAHRDLKPSNILIGRNDKPSILDFGFATAPNAASLTAPGFTVGTLHYVAPELLRGQAATPAADIYSLGVVLYRCVTGNFPHEAANAARLLEAVASGAPVPPRKVNPAISPELEQVIMRATASDPGERTRSANELEQALAAHDRGPQAGDTDAGVQAPSVGEPRAPSDTEATTLVAMPWNRDIDLMVSQVLQSPSYSALLRQKMSHTTVLFSDIVGITRFFDRHGDVKGYQRLERHNALLFPVITEHRGVVVKTIGDAIMATFAEVNDAVRGAVAMQRALAAHNETCALPRDRMRIRIGLHSGKAMIQASDVFGDTVNVAARISALASGDEILMSEATRDAVRDPSIELRFHSRSELKGKQAHFLLYNARWRESAPSLEFEDEPTDTALDPEQSRSKSGESTLSDATQLTTFSPHSEREADTSARPDFAFDDRPTETRSPGERTDVDSTVIQFVGRRGFDDTGTARWKRFIMRSTRSRHWRRAAVTALVVVALWLGIAALRRPNEVDVRSEPPVTSPRPIEATAAPPRPPPATPAAVTPQAPAQAEATPVNDARPAKAETSTRRPEPERTTPAVRSGGAKAQPRRTTGSVGPERSEQQKLADLARKRGLRRGDVDELDRAMEEVSAAFKAGAAEKARGALDKAWNLIEKIRVDRRFVSAKLGRVNARFDQLPRGAATSDLNEALAAAAKHLAGGSYDQANLALNRALDIMDHRRP